MAQRDSTQNRLWVISELYYPEDTSTGYYLTKIAEGLAERSSQPVHVLCGRPAYAARGRTTSKTEMHNGVQIRRCAGTTWNKDCVMLRIVNLITLCISMFFQALWRIRKGERVLVVTNPPLLPFVISWACRIKRAKCVLLIHDVYPDVAVAAGLLKQSSWVTRFSRWAVRRLYRSMDQIVVLGRDMKTLVAQQIPDRENRITIIPNWADTDLIKPRFGQNRILRDLGLTGKFVLQYSGNMGRSHNLEAIVQCAEGLKHRQDIHFLIVGGGAKKTWLEKTITERKLTNITLAKRYPREDLAELLTAGDAALIAFVPGMAGVSVPSRLYNILAAGKPVIALTDFHSELAQVIFEEQVGWVISPKDPATFQSVILEAASQSELLKDMGHRARAAAETTYQPIQILDAYYEILTDCPIPHATEPRYSRAA